MGDPLGIISALQAASKPDQAKRQAASDPDAFKAQLRAQIDQLAKLEQMVSNSAQAVAEHKPDAIAKYIQLLSSPPLPPSTIDTIELDDFELCSKAVVSFFLK